MAMSVRHGNLVRDDSFCILKMISCYTNIVECQSCFGPKTNACYLCFLKEREGILYFLPCSMKIKGSFTSRPSNIRFFQSFFFQFFSILSISLHQLSVKTFFVEITQLSQVFYTFQYISEDIFKCLALRTHYSPGGLFSHVLAILFFAVWMTWKSFPIPFIFITCAAF